MVLLLEWDLVMGVELEHDFVDVGLVGIVTLWSWVVKSGE